MRPELPGVLEEAAREEGAPPARHPGPVSVGSQALRGTAQRRARFRVQLLSSPHVLPACPPDCGTETLHHPTLCPGLLPVSAASFQACVALAYL